jgi:hypothetical protein
MRQVRGEVKAHGTYRHTPEELTFAARVAWRNSSRCIGRLYWRRLRVRDRRQVSAADQIAAECVSHLREATNSGQIRPMITVFAPDAPARPGPRILNSQLIGYAGHQPGQAVIGDAAHREITRLARELGWRPSDPPGRFDLLPLIIQSPGLPRAWFELPRDAVLEVPLRHPDLAWFRELRLRWYALHDPAEGTEEPVPLFIHGWREQLAKTGLAEEQLAVEEAHRLVASVGDVAESLLDRRDRRVGLGCCLLQAGVRLLAWLLMLRFGCRSLRRLGLRRGHLPRRHLLDMGLLARSIRPPGCLLRILSGRIGGSIGYRREFWRVVLLRHPGLRQFHRILRCRQPGGRGQQRGCGEEFLLSVSIHGPQTLMQPGQRIQVLAPRAHPPPGH